MMFSRKLAIYSPLLFLCFGHIRAEDQTDPFAVVEKEAVDRSGDKTSEHFISDALLKLFGERRLDEGFGKESTLIRITVLRTFDAPLMFKWYPGEQGGESVLQVKRLKFVINEKGEKIIKNLDLNQKLVLRPSQKRFLKTVYGKSPLADLTQKSPLYHDDEINSMLDGSLWIYEVAGSKKSIVIVRHNPIDPQLEGKKIAPNKLVPELQLTTFAMLLWGLSGIDERPY